MLINNMSIAATLIVNFHLIIVLVNVQSHLEFLTLPPII